MLGAQETIAPLVEPTADERAALTRLAVTTRHLAWLAYGGFALGVVAAWAGQPWLTVVGLTVLVSYIVYTIRIAAFRCPRCGGSYRFGAHAFESRYPRDRCSNGCGLLYRPY